MPKKKITKYTVPEDQDGSEILPNKLGLTTKKEIDKEEFAGFLSAQLHFIDQLSPDTIFNLKYLYTIHKTALGHLYSFAGKLRTVNMSKGGFVFPAARFLPEGMQEFERDMLLTLSGEYDSEDQFISDLARAHAELLFLHPFREGNGRTARLLANLMIEKHYQKEINFPKMLAENMPEYIRAVQQAAVKEYTLMEALIRKVMTP